LLQDTSAMLIICQWNLEDKANHPLMHPNSLLQWLVGSKEYNWNSLPDVLKEYVCIFLHLVILSKTQTFYSWFCY